MSRRIRDYAEEREDFKIKLLEPKGTVKGWIFIFIV